MKTIKFNQLTWLAVKYRDVYAPAHARQNASRARGNIDFSDTIARAQGDRTTRFSTKKGGKKAVTHAREYKNVTTNAHARGNKESIKEISESESGRNSDEVYDLELVTRGGVKDQFKGSYVKFR